MFSAGGVGRVFVMVAWPCTSPRGLLIAGSTRFRVYPMCIAHELKVFGSPVGTTTCQHYYGDGERMVQKPLRMAAVHPRPGHCFAGAISKF